MVYDADQRYHELCFDLAADKVRVIDASISSIESREAALMALRQIGQPKPVLEGVLIFVNDFLLKFSCDPNGGAGRLNEHHLTRSMGWMKSTP